MANSWNDSPPDRVRPPSWHQRVADGTLPWPTLGGSAMAAVSARGVICHDTPHLSLHQPHWLSWPPLLTIAFHRRSVFGLVVGGDLKRERLGVLEMRAAVQPDAGDAGHGELDCERTWPTSPRQRPRRRWDPRPRWRRDCLRGARWRAGSGAQRADRCCGGGDGLREPGREGSLRRCSALPTVWAKFEKSEGGA